MIDAGHPRDDHVSAGPYTLRPWAAADLPWLVDALQDPDIVRWTRVPHPYRAHDALAYFEAVTSTRRADAAYSYAIVRTDSDELLGAMDVRDLDGADPGRIGYWVAWEARRTGVASTALDGLARWSFERLGLASVWMVVAEANRASRRVAERAGFRVERTEPGGCADGDEPALGIIYVRTGTEA